MKKLVSTAVLAATIAFASPLVAQEDPWPFEGGEYVEVTGIDLADGASLQYAKWLAGEWRANEDFAVEQGWLNSYEILWNTHPRHDEPDIYLIRRFPSFTDNAEDERRRKIMMARYKRSEEKLEAESGERATYRTVMSTMLLRKAEWKD